MTSPSDIFFPTDLASVFAAVDPQRLLDAASSFPGGTVAMVFALFWAPIGPGIPAGVLLAQRAGINPALTFGLYALSDVLGALVCHPLYVLLRRGAARVPALRAVGQRLVKIALFGAPKPPVEELRGGGRGALPVLFRIGTVGFGMDVYTAGMLVAGLPVPRLAGWGAAIVGDLIWFALLLGTSIATGQLTDNSTTQLIVMIGVMVLVPRLMKRLFPALA